YLLPLPTTQEWGEDRGASELFEKKGASSPRPSPPSDGGEGVLVAALPRCVLCTAIFKIVRKPRLKFQPGSAYSAYSAVDSFWLRLCRAGLQSLVFLSGCE